MPAVQSDRKKTGRNGVIYSQQNNAGRGMGNVLEDGVAGAGGFRFVRGRVSFRFAESLNAGFSFHPSTQVAVKIIDKTQLNSSSLQKVKGSRPAVLTRGRLPPAPHNCASVTASLLGPGPAEQGAWSGSQIGGGEILTAGKASGGSSLGCSDVTGGQRWVERL